ncbi:MAG: U32 family peptidase, partial [Firmicutes bacterium]|nr:U32 family peptidase [Candidatus Colimorpha enterica]
MKRPELLSPAGNIEKMKAGFSFGADACYLAGKGFGMRTAADNFTEDELNEAVKYAHALGKKVYVTVNVMPHGDEYAALEKYLDFLDSIGADALIISDLGVLDTANRLAPHCEKHIST